MSLLGYVQLTADIRNSRSVSHGDVGFSELEDDLFWMCRLRGILITS